MTWNSKEQALYKYNFSPRQKVPQSLWALIVSWGFFLSSSYFDSPNVIVLASNFLDPSCFLFLGELAAFFPNSFIFHVELESI